MKRANNRKTKQYENRVIFNLGNVSVLAKNMPDNDDIKKRYQDYITTFADTANKIVAALESDLKLSTLIADAQQAIFETSHQQSSYKTVTHNIMDNLLLDIQKAFDDWGLTESQETLLLEIINKSTQDFIHHHEEGMKTDDKVKEVIDKLCTL